jgi:hypothetical protein
MCPHAYLEALTGQPISNLVLGQENFAIARLVMFRDNREYDRTSVLVAIDIQSANAACARKRRAKLRLQQ